MKYILSALIALTFVVVGGHSDPVFAEGEEQVQPTGESILVAQDSSKKKKKKKRKKRRKKKRSFVRPYGLAGCGFGSAVMGREGSQILAATTNGTSYSNLFGISSGTVNCVDSPMDEMAQRMDNYVSGNKVALASDMARGQGETLYNVSGIMGCSNVDRLGSVLQQNFTTIYTNEAVNHMDITDSMITVIMNDQVLSQSCTGVI